MNQRAIRSAIDLVAERAADHDNQTALVHQDSGMSYAELEAAARRFGASLARRHIERFAAVFRSPVDLVVALIGASASGIEACAYPSDASRHEIETLASAFDHFVIVTDRVDLDGATSTVLHPADLSEAAADEPKARSTTAPLLVLTTGSTGQPKATRHDWGRLVAASSRWASAPTARWLLTYGLHQFAGQQVLLHVLGSGATLVIPSSNQPRDALTALEAAEVTHISATPTFWRLLLGLLGNRPLQTPLEQITIGGEAVPDDLPRRLRSVFPGARLSQVYASTEIGSAAATDGDDGGLPLAVLERGTDAPVQFRVVDGELHALSRAGMLGYYGEDDGDDWRPTGDLVEIDGDRLRFIGRAVDVVNVGGVKVHPLVVEERVLALPGVSLARARGRPNPISGQIVVLDVVASDAHGEPELDAIEARIREACADLPAAARPRRISFVDAMETPGQKLRRSGENP